MSKPVPEEDIDMADRMAPTASEPWKALISLARNQGADSEALRDLLWILNAHPRLIGHQKCFHNLRGLLTEPNLTNAVHEWASGWSSMLARWHSISEWVAGLRPGLTPEVEPLFRQPRHERHHLLMRHGINRHPLAGALWTEHHSALCHPGVFRLAAQAHSELQWHFFCMQAEARYRGSTRTQYEAYAGAPEWPESPRPGDAMGLAVRDLSYPELDDLTKALPTEDSTPRFADALIDAKDNLLRIAEPFGAQIRVLAMVRYAEAFKGLLDGEPWLRRPRDTTTTEREGGRWTVPGFVRVSGALVVLFEPPEDDPLDEDIPHRDSVRVHLAEESLTPAALDAMEQQGISPAEVVTQALDLFHPGKKPGGMMSLISQRLALEAAAQRHPWDRRNLTPLELAELFRHLENLASAAAETADLLTSEARLALLAMLLLGCGLDDVLAARIAPDPNVQSDAVPRHELGNGRLLLIDPVSARVIGHSIPTVQPLYRLPADQAFAACAEASAERFVLPDFTSLGLELLGHATRNGAPNSGRIFISNRSALQAAIDAILREVNQCLDPDTRGRVTVAKIRSKLGALLYQAGLDETAVALITNDRRFARSARLHYTQHSVDRLQSGYVKAIRRMLKSAGRLSLYRPPDGAECTLDPANAPSKASFQMAAGARLVVSRDRLSSLVCELRGDIERKPNRLRSAFHRYHQDFLLYCLLMQNFETGGRVVQDPGHLYKEWAHSPQSLGAPSVARQRQFVVSLADKDNQYRSRARAIFLPPSLRRQFQHLQSHAAGYWRWQPVTSPQPQAGTSPTPFVDWDAADTKPRAIILGPTWIAQQLQRRGFPVPTNFHRGYLRTQLLFRGCPPQTVDAFLGHAETGEVPHIRHGSFDYDVWRQHIEAHVAEITKEAGLIPVPSQLQAIEAQPRQDFE